MEKCSKRRLTNVNIDWASNHIICSELLEPNYRKGETVGYKEKGLTWKQRNKYTLYSSDHGHWANHTGKLLLIYLFIHSVYSKSFLAHQSTLPDAVLEKQECVCHRNSCITLGSILGSKLQFETYLIRHLSVI